MRQGTTGQEEDDEVDAMTEKSTIGELETARTEATTDASELTESELEAAAGGDGVSPNVQNVFNDLNQNTAVQFDLPNYIEHNLPLAEPRGGYVSYPFYQGLQTPGPAPGQ